MYIYISQVSSVYMLCCDCTGMQCVMFVCSIIVILCSLFTANAEEKKSCKIPDGRMVKVGEQHDVPGYCYGNICVGNEEFNFTTCKLIVVPYGWTVTGLDPAKGFPECCGEAIPPLGIVPDILDHLEDSESWEISYEDNATVDMGNGLTPAQVKEQPSVKYNSWADPKALYLLAMVDPDVPSVQDPKTMEFLHWLVGNIPGDDIVLGEVLAAYIGSGLSQDTGLHRYVFLLYKQPEKLTFDEVRINEDTNHRRKMFSVRKFTEKYKLGDPVAINVFQAEYDDYVTDQHKKLFKPNTTNDVIES